LSKLSDFARLRADQGLPLDAMLHSFRAGGLVFWKTMLGAAENEPAIRDETLFSASEYMFRYLDLVSRHTSLAYLDQAGRRGRWRDRAKQDLADAVFGARGEERFRECATPLGFDPTAPVCAIALRLREGNGDPRDDDDLAETVAAGLGVRPDAIFDVLHHGHVIAWIPAGTPGWIERDDERLAAACRRLIERPGIEAVGVGASGAGPISWRSSAEQAIRALELGPRLSDADHIHRYQDVALYDLAIRTPELADFLRSVIERTAPDPELLHTLTEYFRAGRHAKAASAALQVHPNTLSYRLRRAEKVLGGDLDNHEWALKLQLALKLREIGAQASRSPRS
jgi:sugar diacid utilization regulator